MSARRQPPNVAAAVAALDPGFAPSMPVAAPQPTEARDEPAGLTEAEVLDGIRDGTFVVDPETGDVSSRGRRLVPFSNRTDRRRFVRLHLNGKRRGIAVARLVWMAVTRQLIPDGFEIHHDDEDCGNDAWSNLICLHALDHRKQHATTTTAEEIPF